MQLFFRFKANLYVSVMACISGIQQNILKENSYEARYIYIHIYTYIERTGVNVIQLY